MPYILNFSPLYSMRYWFSYACFWFRSLSVHFRFY